MIKSDKQGIELMIKNKNILNGLLVLLLSVLLAACGGGSSGGGNDSQGGTPPANEQGSDTNNEADTENGGDSNDPGSDSDDGSDDGSGELDDEIADSPLTIILNNLKEGGPGETLIDETKVTLEVSRKIFMPKDEGEMESFVSSLGSNDSYIDLMDGDVAREVADNIYRKAFGYQDIFSLRIHQAEEDIIPIDNLPPAELYRPNTRHYFMPSKAAEFASSDLPLVTTGALLNDEEQGVGFMRLIASGFEDEANPSAVSSEPIINCNKAGGHSVCEYGKDYYLKLTNKQTNSFYYHIPIHIGHPNPNERSIISGAAIIQPKKGWVASGAFIYAPSMSLVDSNYRIPVFVNKGEALEGEISLLATLGNMPSIYPDEDLLEASRRLSYVAANVSIKEDVNLPVSPDGVQGRFLQKFKGTYIEPHKTFNTAVIADIERAADSDFKAYSIKGNGRFFYSRPVLNESGELEKDQEGWVNFEIEEPVFLNPNISGKMTISTSLASCEVIFNEFDADTIICHEL